MQLSLSLDFQKLSSYNIIINVAAALKAGLWSRGINRTLTCGIGTLLSSIICVHSFVSGCVCSCLYHTKKTSFSGRFYLLVARVGLFRFAPFTALIASRPAHPRVPFACSQTNLSLVLIRLPYKTKKAPRRVHFVLLVARVGFEPTTRGL